jgi:PAS domain S-box-containing protein
MADLAGVMAESPQRVLQRLADAALRLTGADSAGVSVLDATAADGRGVFRWAATAGAFAPFAGGTLPRDFSPCGVVLDRAATQLMADPVRFYPYIDDLRPPVREVLLVPFYRGDTPVGTVWVVAHTDAKHFDAEDARLVTSLSRFASAAVQALTHAEAVRASEARLRQMADAMPQMVWVALPDGHHEYFNRRWYEFTGVPDGSTDGEGWNGVFHPDDRDRAWAAWRHSLATADPYEIEYRLRHHTGEYRWTLGRALPVRGARGEVERWFGTCTDIDAIRRLTAERERLLGSERAARADAEAANRAKDRSSPS